jgi:Na+/H+ antiporter NhaD/arsenite permease-like protein
MILPFVLLLGIIAIAPLISARWWARHHVAISFGIGSIALVYYLLILRDTAQVWHVARDYISFVSLIASLFIVSGGLHISIKWQGTPLQNVIFLFLGALIANVIGTTGAAMLLIRPWIRMNEHRVTAYHVVFFIFIVANAGGCLTPIGDPPLFLGYLRGVPFWWITLHAWPVWLCGVGTLLVMFYVLDLINFRKFSLSAHEPETPTGSWGFQGAANLFFLGIILAAVFIEQPPFLREIIMLAAAAGSYFTTKKSVHEANDFNFHPIKEVAVLFFGIFATMMPALGWLNANARTLLGADAGPGIFFWSTGCLSGVLDNAPTYLGFLTALSGVTSLEDIGQLLARNASHVLAISMGAVFFGAATYIGNGPNFLVKAIADQHRINAPTFFGYIFKFTMPFLLPMLLLVWLLFFRA